MLRSLGFWTLWSWWVVVICDPLVLSAARSRSGRWTSGGDRAAAMVVRGFRLVRAETRRVGVELVGERSGGAGFTCPDRPGSSCPCPGAVLRLRPWSGRRNELGACRCSRVAARPSGRSIPVGFLCWSGFGFAAVTAGVDRVATSHPTSSHSDRLPKRTTQLPGHRAASGGLSTGIRDVYGTAGG